MRMNAVLSNPKHPEYGQFTVPLPIPHNQYDGIMEALNAMDMGDPLARDCQMDEILGEYPILKRLEGKPVNIDELDYLAKRLDSFCYEAEHARERKIQKTMLRIKKKFGKNAILKGMNLEDGATARERNQTIGGHQA